MDTVSPKVWFQGVEASRRNGLPVFFLVIQGNVLMVKFNRSELQNMITSMGGEQNDVELSVSGDVGTMKFEGFDTMGVNY